MNKILWFCEVFISRYIPVGGFVAATESGKSYRIYVKIPPKCRPYITFTKRRWGKHSRAYTIFLWNEELFYSKLIYFIGVVYRDDMLFYDGRKWKSKLFYFIRKTKEKKGSEQMNEVLENTTEFHPAHVVIEAQGKEETLLVQTDEETGAKDEVVTASPTVH